jgi:hypothetical protein
LGINTVEFGRFDQRICNGGRFAAALGPHEQIIFTTERQFLFILPMSTTPSSIIPGILVSVASCVGFIVDATRMEIVSM